MHSSLKYLYILVDATCPFYDSSSDTEMPNVIGHTVDPFLAMEYMRNNSPAAISGNDPDPGFYFYDAHPHRTYKLYKVCCFTNPDNERQADELVARAEWSVVRINGDPLMPEDVDASVHSLDGFTWSLQNLEAHPERVRSVMEMP